MSEQENRLVTRWDGHEVKLKALIPIIRDNSEWHETDQYKELISAVGVPEPFGEVERDLRGANFQQAVSIGHTAGDLAAPALEDRDGRIGDRLAGLHIGGPHQHLVG